MINNLSCTHVVQLKLRDDAEFLEFNTYFYESGVEGWMHMETIHWRKYIFYALFWKHNNFFILQTKIFPYFKNQKRIFFEI